MKAILLWRASLYLTPCLTAACLSTAGDDTSTTQLYSDCENNSDCGGSGLLCDERRGCVECIEDDDCPSSRQCSVGQCELRQDRSGGENGSDSGSASPEADPEDVSNDAGNTPEGTNPNPNPDPNPGPSPEGSTAPSPGPGDPAPASPNPSANPNPSPGPNATPEPSPSMPAPSDACQVNGQRVVRLPAVFRDFSNDHPDFGGHAGCFETVAGLVDDELDGNGRPVLVATDPNACIASPASFADWYVDNAENVRLDSEIVLFDDGQGGFVNRFGPNGEQISSVEYGTERGGSDSEPTCSTICAYLASGDTECAATCTALHDDAAGAASLYEVAVESGEYDEAALAALLAEADAAASEASACDSSCAPQVATSEAACSATCKPCSYNPTFYCAYGTEVVYDGTPLFFPVDGITGSTEDRGEAKLPEEYGYLGWPWEADVFGTAVLHNFSFTTEIQFDAVYGSGAGATLELMGDDDLWVFINGKLAIDLGGLHVPSPGAVTIDAASAGSFGLTDGQQYRISIFHAERQEEGSSFRLRLSGFGSTSPDECSDE